MLGIHDQGIRLCDGLSRREMLRVGGLGLAGLSLPGLLAAEGSKPREDVAREAFGRAKSCIILFLLGGPPQQETFDMKPDAPAEIRGPFQPIATNVPGIQVCELLPNVARQMDKIAVLRAMSTNDNAHSSSGYWMLTGYPHTPLNTENARPAFPNDHPCLAAVVKMLRTSPLNPPLRSGEGRRGERFPLPASIVVPEHIWNTGMIPWPGQDAGFLGRTADPWLIHCDPNSPEFHIPGLKLPADLPPLRLNDRNSLLDQVNRHLDSADARTIEGKGTGEWGTPFVQHDSLHQQALDLLRSAQARRAFDIDREPPAVRDRYGRHRFGQSVLLARRLIEAGVRLVQVNWQRDPDGSDAAPAWDTHHKNAELLKTRLCPPMELAYSALLEDLAQRGLLDETLVVWMGEFGRTPKINGAAGRDHWGHVFSVALAGGGIRGGIVHGASDKIAGYPKDGKLEPSDLAATIFHCLGIDPHSEIQDQFGRPLPVARGSVIRQLVG
jgi:hypothetical protein